jgi:curli biogenesis system outer membrane secretion channel CsgG
MKTLLLLASLLLAAAAQYGMAQTTGGEKAQTAKTAEIPKPEENIGKVREFQDDKNTIFVRLDRSKEDTSKFDRIYVIVNGSEKDGYDGYVTEFVFEQGYKIVLVKNKNRNEEHAFSAGDNAPPSAIKNAVDYIKAAILNDKIYNPSNPIDISF